MGALAVTPEFLMWRLWWSLRQWHRGATPAFRLILRQSTIHRPDANILEPGVLWSLQIARRMMALNQSHLLDLLSVSPMGQLRSRWQLAQMMMHYPAPLHQAAWIGMWWLRLISVNLWLFGFSGGYFGVLDFITDWAVLIVALLALNVYDVVLGALLGLLTPMLGLEDNLSLLLTVIGHLALIVLPLVLVLLPNSWILHHSGQAWMFALFRLIQLAALIGLLEGIVRGLWQRLLDLTGATADEVNGVL